MGKHAAESHRKKKGTSKKKRRSQRDSSIKVSKIILVLVVCIIVGVSISFFLFNGNRKVLSTINNVFTELKNHNKEEAKKYIDYEGLLCSIDDIFATEDNKEVENVANELFKNIEWKVENVEIKENKASAVIEVTNKDFKYVITRWIKEIVVSKSTNKEITDELILQKLEKALKEETTNKTVIKKVTLNKEENEWKLQVDEDLRDLVYPGIDSVIAGLATE